MVKTHLHPSQLHTGEHETRTASLARDGSSVADLHAACLAALFGHVCKGKNPKSHGRPVSAALIAADFFEFQYTYGELLHMRRYMPLIFSNAYSGSDGPLPSKNTPATSSRVPHCSCLKCPGKKLKEYEQSPKYDGNSNQKKFPIRVQLGLLQFKSLMPIVLIGRLRSKILNTDMTQLCMV